jgi:soluble lytic murein transglycosylase-like protein
VLRGKKVLEFVKAFHEGIVSFVVCVFVVSCLAVIRPRGIKFEGESLHQVRARYGIYDSFSPNLPPRRGVPLGYEAVFEAASRETGVPLGILESIAYAESKFEAFVISPPREDGTQDLGMFQLHSGYLDWFARQYNEGKPFNPLNPKEAVWIVARHLKRLYDQLGVWPDVVIAYNAGYSVIASGRIPESTWDYLVKVYN